jgi:hypothetical protein
LEGHVAAFEWFGGAFGLVRYDNLGSAVVNVLKGRRRVESDRFVALRSHISPSRASRARARKARTRRAAWRAMWAASAAPTWCRSQRSPCWPSSTTGSRRRTSTDLRLTIRGRRKTVGEALSREIDLLRSLPAEPFDTAEHATPRVDSKSLATIRQNQSSLPVRLAGLRVAARIGAGEIVFCHGGREVARHERLRGRFGTSAQLDHYLELLQVKPGALARSLALRQQRERGAWPDSFDQLWHAIQARVGASEAARQMVEVLILCRELGPARVELATRGALAAGAHDGRAVAVLARRGEHSLHR